MGIAINWGKLVAPQIPVGMDEAFRMVVEFNVRDVTGFEKLAGGGFVRGGVNIDGFSFTSGLVVTVGPGEI